MDTLHLVAADKVLTVFIPTTPNPTSGFLVVVSPEEVVDLNFTVEEAFKFFVSGGIVGKDLAAPSLPPEIGSSGQKPLRVAVTRPAEQTRGKVPTEPSG